MQDSEANECPHIAALETLRTPQLLECEECVKNKSKWVHLRTCQTCGVTLCCDSSPNKHATQHFRQTGHPVVISAEKGERWLWCYADEQFVEY
jgi:uncharacterized UBP type Zn finger protein